MKPERLPDRAELDETNLGRGHSRNDVHEEGGRLEERIQAVGTRFARPIRQSFESTESRRRLHPMASVVRAMCLHFQVYGKSEHIQEISILFSHDKGKRYAECTRQIMTNSYGRVS